MTTIGRLKPVKLGGFRPIAVVGYLQNQGLLTDAQRLALERTQRQPALIYAHTVVFDSERRWDVGDFVRTSLLHQFSDDFKTLNSVYLLLGPGSRKRASADTIACLI